MSEKVKVKIKCSKSMRPIYKSDLASGADLLSSRGVFLDPGSIQVVETGVRIELPPGYEAQVRSRSGLAAVHGVIVLNSPGTVDADYRGEIGVILMNLGTAPVKFDTGDRIAQLVIAKVERAEFVEVEEEELGETERGEGGFGSTGV